MRIFILVIGVSFMLTGCMSTDKSHELVKGKKVDPQTLAAAKKAIGYRCERVKTTGSKMKHKRCTTFAQREEESRKAKEFIDETVANDPIFEKAGDGL